MRKKRIISEETLTTWITLSALSAIVVIAAANLLWYMIYGCWLMRSIQPGNAGCISESLPSWTYLLPAIIGSITGTYLTKLHMQKTADSSKQ